MNPPSRATDEDVLEMVRLRHEGTSPSDIATRFGTYNSQVLDRTNNVMKADLAESGEPIREVMKHYWEKRK